MENLLPDSVHACATLVELLRWRAAQTPDRIAYTFLTETETPELSLTYSALDRQARSIGARLQALGAAGERVLLLYPPGLEYIAALFGCFYAGAVAVPAYPPRHNRSLPRLTGIANDARAMVALTTSHILKRLKVAPGRANPLNSLHFLATDALSVVADCDWRRPPATGETLALLQYTSGSTGTPKGAMLTHRNLLHNSALLAQAFEYGPASCCVTWLPVYHDMGLIGGILQPLYGGFACVLMSPASFLQSPFRWLQAISRFRGTISGGPNFAYDLCVTKISPSQRATLDLSSWEVAFNGAEPIRAATLERFAAAFADCGFRQEAFFTCYGLAEATLIVTGGRKGRGPVVRQVKTSELGQNKAIAAPAEAPDTRPLVSSGRVLPGQRIVIVEPETGAICRPRQIGEVWLASASVAQGYWARSEETDATFRAHLSDTAEGPFLRTGDLGFLQDEELYVLGRRKDLIIIRGLNYYPQDLEQSAQRGHAALRPGCGAAFFSDDGSEERLVIVYEVDLPLPEPQAVINGIRRVVASDHNLQVQAIALIRPGTISKTSSGKIQRSACRAAFLSGQLASLALWQAGSEGASAPPLPPPSLDRLADIQAWLVELLALKLDVPQADLAVDAPIVSFGLDSLQAFELTQLIESALGLTLPLTRLLEGTSISELARQTLTANSVSPPAAQADSPSDKARHEFPLSHGQRALWFLHQLAPQSASYHLASAVRIRSELNVVALRNAFQALVDRHASLRTIFPNRNGEPVQQVRDTVVFNFVEHDAALWSEAVLQDRLTEAAHQPFELEQGPLLRVVLFRRSASESILLLVVHHIVADFWSLAMLLNELSQLYSAELQGRPLALPPLERHYCDYVRGQTELLAGPEGERLWAYWSKQLAGELPVLNLPTDRPRPPVPTDRGAAHRFKLSPVVTARLKELGRRQGTTLYMTLLAAFQVLLHRYTGQAELLVGSLTSGRQPVPFADLCGYFVNPIVLRADLSGDPSFVEYLGRVRRTVLAAFDHQAYPFPLLVERLQPARDPARSPLFQVLFSYQKSPQFKADSLAALALGEAGQHLSLGDLSVESVALDQQAVQFDLVLALAEVAGAVSASVQYNSDLFDAATIERLAGHFQTLSESIVTAPLERLSKLALLTPRERALLVKEWNRTEVELPRLRCLHQLFEAQVRSTPQNPALIFRDRCWSYDELNRRANQLAHYLRSLGVGPQVTVGVLLERSAEMVVGILAILKAGGAYVPLDPAYPADRLNFILNDVAAPVLLTQRRLLGPWSARQATVVCLDSHWDVISGESDDNLAVLAQPDDLAYIIYTSGSTGQPKGVMISHRSVVNFLIGMDDRIGCDTTDTLLAVTSISFDISNLELFWPLTRGARLVLLDEQATGPSVRRAAQPRPAKPIDFSLFFFASNDSATASEGYRLVLEGAKFADANGFEAVWTPERHFHGFGGLYPNPSVMSAALATLTERVKIRAGSVVLPLHHPLRIAEEWSLVDNLSKGRVGLAFASGWHADDFVFFPQHYANRKALTFQGVNLIRALWRGEAMKVTGGAGHEIEVKIFPRPIQSELPVWLTAAGMPETFIKAGELGANVLTHLLGQTVEAVAQNIELYRQSLARHGYDGQAGRVTLMLHTFLGEEKEQVRQLVRDPFKNYLRSSVGLIDNLIRSLNLPLDLTRISQADMADLLEYAFNRYFNTSTLLGTPASCADLVEHLRIIGVDEVACLIDFGVAVDAVLASLPRLNQLKGLVNQRPEAAAFSLAAQAEKYQPTLLQCTPSLMRMISLEPEALRSLKSLRALLLGGEALPPALAAQLKEELTAKVINMYGPTETTIWSTTHVVDELANPIPIGRPIANTQLYVMDRYWQVLPVGIAGELCIGGAGLAYGYHNRPDLAADKFIPHPFSHDAGARLYRTGDLARYLPTGALEFLGRVDQQVKVRGYRIELEEIESVLGEHPAVAAVVVVVRETEAGDKRLVAYVVPVTNAVLNVEELRSAVREKLPDYMVPAYFLMLDRLPLTPNGKVDRKNLPSPDHTRSPGEARSTPPRDKLELLIAEIWQRALKLDQVGIHDNFFDLGGHSLLMAQLHSQLRDSLQVELPLIKLLEHPTISSLAEFLNQGQTNGLAVQPTQERASRVRQGLNRQRRTIQKARYQAQ